jgi:hypothetical protein
MLHFVQEYNEEQFKHFVKIHNSHALVVKFLKY